MRRMGVFSVELMGEVTWPTIQLTTLCPDGTAPRGPRAQELLSTVEQS